MWVNPGKHRQLYVGRRWYAQRRQPSRPGLLTFRTALPGATTLPPTITVGADNLVTIRVRWQLPNGSAHEHMVIAHINQDPEN